MNSTISTVEVRREWGKQIEPKKQNLKNDVHLPKRFKFNKLLQYDDDKW